MIWGNEAHRSYRLVLSFHSPCHPESFLLYLHPPKKDPRPLGLTLILFCPIRCPRAFASLPLHSASFCFSSYRFCLGNHQGWLERCCSCGQQLQHCHCWDHKTTGHTRMGIRYPCTGEHLCLGLLVYLTDRVCPDLIRVIVNNRILVPLVRLCWALYWCPEKFMQTNEAMSNRTENQNHYCSSASWRLLCRGWKDPTLVPFCMLVPELLVKSCLQVPPDGLQRLVTAEPRTS